MTGTAEDTMLMANQKSMQVHKEKKAPLCFFQLFNDIHSTAGRGKGGKMAPSF